MVEVKTCSQESCTVNKDGKCLEGFEDLDQCPHFYLDDNEVGLDDHSKVQENNNDSNVDSKINTIKLFDGEELTIDRLSEVTYRFPANQVFILGEHDSGKTTLLATLFEMFQIGPFHDHSYAGSLTQIGFEKRCFYSRAASENERPDTERTKSEEFRFLHIALKKSIAQKTATHFLISDISGEKIKRAKNNSEDMKDLLVVANATHVSFVIDGEKLIEPRSRQAAILQAKSFIRKAIDEEVFNKKTRLTLVLSKWDLLSKAANFDYPNLIEVSFKNSFEKDLLELTFLKIAVRPKIFNDGFALGNGLANMIDLWSPESNYQTNEEIEISSSRMIDHFKFR